METRGIRVNVDGTTTLVSIDTDTTTAHMQELRDAIDCRYLDAIRLPRNIDCWIDDEGLYTAEINPTLTRMIQADVPGHSAVAGAGVFLAVDQETGETISLDPVQTAHILEQWTRAAVAGLDVGAILATFATLSQ